MSPLVSQLLVGIPILGVGFGGLAVLILDDAGELLRVWRRRHELDELWRDDPAPAELHLVEVARP